MNIFIDNEQLDFQLENEKNLTDVIIGLKKWLSTENFIISGLTVDNSQVDYTSHSKLAEYDITNIDKINISTMSISEFKLSQLETIQQYFKIVLNNINSGDNSNILTVLEDYKDIKPLLKINIDRIYENNNGFIENIIENKQEIDKNIDKLKFFCENIIIISETRKAEIISPDNELKQLKKQFDKTAEDAGNVSILLQTGKDKEAMETVIEFVEFMKKLSRILGILDLKNNSPDKNNEISGFNSMLSELCNAIENSDSVLVGDLLEYEIVPVIESLLTVN